MRPINSVCLALGMFLIASAGLAQDAYLTGLNVPRYIKAGVNYPITVRARNYSSTAYTFFQVNWRLNSGTVHTMNQPVGGGGIVAGNFLEVTHPVPLNSVQGPQMLQVWITVAGETNSSNDTLTANFTALNNWAPKVVLLEARTETWCPQCPPSNTATNLLKQDPAFAVAKFHLSDGFGFDDARSYYAQYDTSFTPAGVLELGEYGEYTANPQHNQWPAQMSERASGVSPVVIAMNATVNNSTRQLTVTLNATFTYQLTGPFKMNVYLTEDHVPGPQQNAPSDYIHNGVMRAMLGGWEGTSGVIPSSPTVGINYSHTYNYTIPAGYEIEHLDLIGIVEHAPGINNRYALNSITSEHAPVGITEPALNTTSMAIHPNPFNEVINLHVSGMSGPVVLELLAIDGRSLSRSMVVLNVDGRLTTSIGDLPAGIYLVRVSDGNAVATQRVVRSKP